MDTTTPQFVGTYSTQIYAQLWRVVWYPHSQHPEQIQETWWFKGPYIRHDIRGEVAIGYGRTKNEALTNARQAVVMLLNHVLCNCRYPSTPCKDS